MSDQEKLAKVRELSLNAMKLLNELGDSENINFAKNKLDRSVFFVEKEEDRLKGLHVEPIDEKAEAEEEHVQQDETTIKPLEKKADSPI